MKKKMKALSLGAVLWDVIGSQEYIGGAPFNLAVNLKRIGAESALVTAIGRDFRGERALKRLIEYGVSGEFIQTAEDLGTGAAFASLAPNGDAVYDIPYAAFDEIAADEENIRRMNAFKPDVICFGSFEQRSEISGKTIRKILNEVKSEHVFFDVNLRMNFVDKEVLEFGFRKSSIVKLNEDERDTISGLFYGKKFGDFDFADRFTADFDLKCLIVTLGAKGCFVFADGKGEAFCPPKTEVADTIGAGDAFSAAFLYSYLNGEPCELAAKKGNALGAYVAGRIGALPEWDKAIYDILKLN